MGTRLALLTRPGAWTLRAKLVASTMALFAVLTIGTGVATVVALHTFLLDQLDSQVQMAARRGDNPRQARNGRVTPQRQGLPAGLGGGFVRVEISLNGTVVENAAADPEEGQISLTKAQLAILQAARIGSTPKTVGLGGKLGNYRLVSSLDPVDGNVRISGLPTAQLDATAVRLSLIVAIVTGTGLALVAVGGFWLVGSTLQPLRRVALTASRVARQPLDSGEVALAERVPTQDTDPRTEIGQVGSALNDMLDHVGNALNARHASEMRVRQFVADASHELRTPLASIRGYTELSRREISQVPPSVAHALDRVHSEANRMSSLVDDLLLLARLDAGRPLDRAPVDLTQLTVDAVSDAHAISPEHIWRLSLPDEPAEVVGDAARLHQIIANLLANARTHTPPGTTVVTSIRSTPDEIQLEVSDDGPGIPEALQQNVFERFARGDSSRSRAGGSTGLGLSIVHAVTEAHGGRVGLRSDSRGTSFLVALPLAPASAPAPVIVG